MRTVQINQEQAALLRVVDKLGMSDAAAIANGLGRSLGSKLEQLVDAGLVVRQASQQPRRRTTLYVIALRGRRALGTFDKKSAASAGSMAAARSPLPAFTGNVYTGAELQPYEGRPGAMDAFNLPSRMGNRLHFRDGSVVPVEHAK